MSLTSVSTVGSAVGVAVAVGTGFGVAAVFRFRASPATRTTLSATDPHITLRSRLATDCLALRDYTCGVERAIALDGCIHSLDLLVSPVCGSLGFRLLVSG